MPVSWSPIKHHNAKEDAITCAKIFLNLLGPNSKETEPDIDYDIKIEFFGFIKGILSDSIVNYKEAFELLYWLEDNPMLGKKYNYLYDELAKALNDEHLDESESIQIKYLLEDILKYT